jgi:hypothetical protein
MPSSDLLKSFLDSETPKNIRMAAARGLAPLPPTAMFQALVSLVGDEDPDVAAEAGLTLQRFPESEIVAMAQATDCRPEVLTYFSHVYDSEAVLEAIILNPVAPGHAIELLALKPSPPLLERILDNRMRLLDAPAILNNIKSNPSATPNVLRLVQEIESDFFSLEKKSDYRLQETPSEAPEETAGTSYLQAETPIEDLSLEGLPADPDEREAAVAVRISMMSVRQKIMHALFGNREARSLLIRDSNKQVARTVLRSPKLSENEIESFASMRNISDEILREIGISSEWTRSYAVVQNLVRNPKTPPVISQRLMFRLRSQDLTFLARDRGIPDAVRISAKRTLDQREKQKSH